MLNKVQLIGNLAADPISRTAGTTEISNFTVATNSQYKKDGEIVKQVEFHRIVVFGALAEICNRYLLKGKLVYIEGSLQTRSYEKDGNTVYTTEVKATDMKMLGGKGDTQQEEAVSAPSAFSPDDDLPF